MKKNKYAFSLIELSIVILIIGILVIGISKGSRIIYTAKIKAAQKLTTNSPITTMSDLVLWLDTTNPTNLGIGTVASSAYTDNPSDNDFVAYWKDRNPQAPDQKTLAAGSDGTRPTYVKNGIGGLPSLNFDGTTDYLSLGTGAISAGKSNYTTIIVFKMTGSTDVWILTQGGGCNGDSASINLYNSANLNFIGCGAGGVADATAGQTTKLNVPYYTIIRMNKNLPSNKMTFYLNSQVGFANPADTSIPIGGTTFILGSRFGSSNFYQGLISEVVVFNRAISNTEVAAIQDYFAKKYGIK